MTTEITIQKKVSSIAESAMQTEINSIESMSYATTLLSDLNTFSKQLTAEKEKVTKPLNEALKAERGRFKPFEDVIETAIAFIRKGMVTYQTEAKRIADAEAAKIAARVGEGRGKLKIETASTKIANIEKAPDKVIADNGSVTFRTDKKFRIVDITKIPYAYLVPNEVAIRQVMKEGKELPGVEYYEEQIPVNRR